MEYTQITPDEFTALDGLDDWTVVGNEIHATFRGSTYLDGAQLVTTIAEIARREASDAAAGMYFI